MKKFVGFKVYGGELSPVLVPVYEDIPTPSPVVPSGLEALEPVIYQQRDRSEMLGRGGEWSAWYASSKATFEQLKATPQPDYEARALVPADAIAALIADLAKLSDPAAVRVNILRGTIAKPDDLVWLHDETGPVAALMAERDAFKLTVTGIWAALGNPAYETLNGLSISEIVADWKARAETAERALADRKEGDA